MVEPVPGKSPMRRGGFLAIACAMLAFGCAGGAHGEPLDQKDLQALKEQLSSSSLLFEDFDSTEMDARVRDVDPACVSRSGLLVTKDGLHLSFSDRMGFRRVIVCYKLTSRTGHLFLHANLPEGQFALFNDALGDWAWKKSGGSRFDCAGFGEPSASNAGKWVLHEIRIEDGALKYFVNQELLGEVPLKGSTALKQFGISANVGGQGIVDFVIVAGDASVSRGKWNVEVVVPPGLTQSAPFDTAVLPDGTVLMAGSGDRLVSVSDDAAVQRTDYPSGMYFECDGTGVMWNYDFPNGRVYRWDPRRRETEEMARLPPSCSDGSIAVAPDGKTVYVCRCLMDKAESALYRFTDHGKPERVLFVPKPSFFRAVEITSAGDVFIGCPDGVYRLHNGTTLEPYHRFKEKIHIASDGLTSDQWGNLYFAAHASPPAVFQLSQKRELKRIVQFPDALDLPFGLSWHRDRRLILGVRKEKGEIVSIDLQGTVRVLNRPSGLTTPIAIDQSPQGAILINGDEVGLLLLDAHNRVQIYCRGMCSFQPPPADFAFDRDGLIYYTCAAPGFVSEIVTIDHNKVIRTLTRAVGSPAGIDAGPGDTMYYADFTRGTVNRLDARGQSSAVVAGLLYPLGLVVDDEGTIWVGIADKVKGAKPGTLGEVSSTFIVKYDGRGRLLETIDFAEWGRPGITFFDVDQAGNLYVPIGDAILRRDPLGTIEVMAEGFANLRSAKVCSDGYLYFVDDGNPALYRIRLD